MAYKTWDLNQEKVWYCSNCSRNIEVEDCYCNHCGEKLEDEDNI